MHCWYCSKVKGKRSCPAHGGDGICSRCCGTKRRVEIQCPDDCPYLFGEHDPRWEPPDRQLEDMRFLSHFAELPRERVPLLVFVHSLLIRARRDLVDQLTDEDLALVLSTLGRTFETLSKGVVYQHKTEDLRLQGVIGRLGEALTRRQQIPGAPPSLDADVLAVLQSVRSAVEAHQKQPENQKSYLETAERIFWATLSELPEPEIPGGPEGGRLIVEP